MRFLYLALCSASTFAIPVAGQTAGPSDIKAAGTLTSGTSVVAELARSLDARKARVGDKVNAIVAQDVISHGQVVIQAGSRLVGHLTRVRISKKGDPGSSVGVIFEKVALKGRGELAFHGQIRALGAPANQASRVDEPEQMLPPGYIPGPSPGPAPQRGTSGATPMGGNTSVPMNPVGPDSRRPSSTRLLSAQSRGVFWLPGLSVSCTAKDDCLIVSAKENVRLEEKTQMVVEAHE